MKRSRNTCDHLQTDQKTAYVQVCKKVRLSLAKMCPTQMKSEPIEDTSTCADHRKKSVSPGELSPSYFTSLEDVLDDSAVQQGWYSSQDHTHPSIESTSSVDDRASQKTYSLKKLSDTASRKQEILVYCELFGRRAAATHYGVPITSIRRLQNSGELFEATTATKRDGNCVLPASRRIQKKYSVFFGTRTSAKGPGALASSAKLSGTPVSSAKRNGTPHSQSTKHSVSALCSDTGCSGTPMSSAKLPGSTVSSLKGLDKYTGSSRIGVRHVRTPSKKKKQAAMLTTWLQLSHDLGMPISSQLLCVQARATLSPFHPSFTATHAWAKR